MPTAPKQYRPPGYSRRATEKQWASRKDGRHALYNLWLWRKPGGLRQQVLERDPLCVVCMRENRITVATEADHIVPHGGDMELFTDFENLQGLCKACHSRKTKAEQG